MIVDFIYLFCPLIMLVFAAVWFFWTKAFESQSEKTIGEVIGYEEREDLDLNILHHPIFRYATRQGQKFVQTL